MDWLIALDRALLYGAGAQQRPWLTPLMLALSRLGDFLTLTVLVAVGVLVFRRFGRPREGRGLLVAGLLCLALDMALKFTVGRERPDVVWRVVDLPKYPSYPSGHAMAGLAVYGLLGVFLTRRVPAPWRHLLVAAGFGLGAMIGVSRVYLGVHFPLDVLAGWMGGTAAALVGLAVSSPPSPAGSGSPPESTTAAPPP